MSHRGVRPPRLARWLVAAWFRPGVREVVLGDLQEMFESAVDAGTPVRQARRQYWGLAFSSVAAAPPWQAHSEGFAMTSPLSWRPWRGMGADVRHGLRGLRRSPGFTMVAVLSLALAIGVNTAIFSLVQNALVRPLNVNHPEELSFVYWGAENTRGRNFSSSGAANPGGGPALRSNFTYELYDRLRAAAPAAVSTAGFNFLREVAVTYGGRPAVSAGAILASGDYFSTLGLTTALGRPIHDADVRPDAPPVVVLSHRFWTEYFGGDPSVIGDTARIAGQLFEIIGVTPASFWGLSPGGFFPPTDITVPLTTQPIVSPAWTPDEGTLFGSPDRFWLRLIARVPGGVSPEPMRQVMQERLRRTLVDGGMTPEDSADTVEVQLLSASRGLDSLRVDIEPPLKFLTVVVGVVLLIACLNLASLQLARGVARQPEVALRRALGAGRWTLIRERLLESGIVAALGGAAGLLVAFWSGPLLAGAMARGFDAAAVDVVLDWRALGTTASISIIAALVSGLLPAMVLTRRQAQPALGVRVAHGAPRMRLGRVLIAVQIALSVPLLVGAGLFLQTVANLSAVDLGFDPRGLVIFRLDPTQTSSDAGRRTQVLQEVVAGMAALPGVTSATLVENALVSGWSSNTRVTIDGEPKNMMMNAVGPGFFDTMGLRLVAGRAIESTDRAGAPMAVVVNDTAARQYFGGQALGRRFIVDTSEAEVVGVVVDSTYESLRRAPRPTFYDSYVQREGGPRVMHVVVRTSGNVQALMAAVPRVVAGVDSGLPVADLRSQAEQIAATIGREQLFGRLLAAFGVVALLLATIGLHGLTSYNVARRTGEIGVRLALGATRGSIVWMVLRQVVWLAVFGLLIGIPMAYQVGPAAGSMLFGLAPTDPLTMLGAVLIMLAVAVAAGGIAARGAGRLDPLAALRTE